MSAWLAALAALALASPVAASPKGAQAKASFDKGVAAYTKGNFEAASAALEISFKAEPDAETLFAWAQSERQLEHCDKAIELFEKLLGFNIPAENKKVVQSKIDECKALFPPKQPEKQPEKKPDKQPEKQPDKGGPIAGPSDPEGGPGPVDRPTPGPERSPWWKDPIGDALVVAGVGAVGVGVYFLMSSKSATSDLDNMVPKTDQDFQDTKDRAKTAGTIGLVSTIAGGALVVGGIVRYVTRDGGAAGKERTAVTGWLSPGGGGLAAIGRF